MRQRRRKVKGSVILLHIQHIKEADQIAAGGMLRVPAVDQNIVKIRIIQDRGDKICLKKTVLEAVDQDWIEDKANVPAVAALVLFSRVQGVRVDQNAVCFFSVWTSKTLGRLLIADEQDDSGKQFSQVETMCEEGVDAIICVIVDSSGGSGPLLS